MEKTKFYRCKKCGTMVGLIHKGGCIPSCCGEEMAELVANTTDAAHEKHVPVITQNGNEVRVAVGSAAHPMEAEHWIQWIYLHTEQGGQRKVLNPGDKPEAVFALADGDKLISAYEYCNKHGLWEAQA